MSDKVKVLDGTFTVNKVEGVATATFENKDAFYQGTEIPKKYLKKFMIIMKTIQHLPLKQLKKQDKEL